MAKIGVTTWLAMASAIAAIAAAGASYFQAHIAREQVELQRKSQRARLKIDGITDILLFRNDSPRILSNIKVSNVGSLPATNITLVSQISHWLTFDVDSWKRECLRNGFAEILKHESDPIYPGFSDERVSSHAYITQNLKPASDENGRQRWIVNYCLSYQSDTDLNKHHLVGVYIVDAPINSVEPLNYNYDQMPAASFGTGKAIEANREVD